MHECRPLLTIVVEAPDPIDKESLLYRRLLIDRFEHSDKYQIRIIDSHITTQILKALCNEEPSDYITVINQYHHISKTYIRTLLTDLGDRTKPLIEPYKYQTSIPATSKPPELTPAYFYGQHIDLHGVAFHTGGLSDAIDAMPDLDRTSIYIAYRLYWSIETAEIAETSYSVASDANSGFGYTPKDSPPRVLPLIKTNSTELKYRILRMMVLYLKGIRETNASSLPLDHLRRIARHFDLTKTLDIAQQMHPFETAWIRWLADPENGKQQYKKLSQHDVVIEFSKRESSKLHSRPQPDTAQSETTDDGIVRALLHDINFTDSSLKITRAYYPQTSAMPAPSEYDFYGRPITPDSIILFFDRPFQADDNAEYLYEYFTQTRPEYTQSYFALNPRSKDWTRLQDKGFKLIKMFSQEFYELFLRSDLVVSSQLFNLRYKGKSLANSRFVYLQHGIQMNDMSNWVASKHFDIFVATGRVEADYLKTVAPLETLNSGLPRLQSLRSSDTPSNRILFMPTWRFNLNQATPEAFRNSRYFKAIDSLLTAPALIKYLEETDTYLDVKLHPNVEKRAHHFQFHNRVNHTNKSYRHSISEAQFVFTDYSSAVLDASFISKPIAYYQWDRDDFFQTQLYKTRMDYETQALGPVFYDSQSMVNYIISGEYLEPNAEFLRRKMQFFEGVDRSQINETIVERMLSL